MKAHPIIRGMIFGITMMTALLAIAQTEKESIPVTREQVQKDLVKIEAAGYDPHRDSSAYPADLQDAESRAAAATNPAAAPTAATRRR